jgi:Notch-like protein
MSLLIGTSFVLLGFGLSVSEGLPQLRKSDNSTCPPDYCLEYESSHNGLSPCQNHGVCYSNQYFKRWACACPCGWYGPTCTINPDDCVRVYEPCLNGGTCIDKVNGYTCQCPIGYFGTYCQLQSGTAIDGFVPNTIGSAKNKGENFCTINGNPCVNGGTCISDTFNTFKCQCRKQYTGTICQIYQGSHSKSSTDDKTNSSCSIDYCAEYENTHNGASPCENHGVCYSNQYFKRWACACPCGWYGPTCTINPDDCLRVQEPCLNGGTCIDKVNGYTCQCLEGYMGTYCQGTINYCQSDPCQNGGTCHAEIDGYTCTCGQGFTGMNCDTDMDEYTTVEDTTRLEVTTSVNPDPPHTSPNLPMEIDYCQIYMDEHNGVQPCQNHGLCYSNKLFKRWVCDCPCGWYGPTCTINPDDCLRYGDPCLNGGTCVDHVNGFSCQCPYGYAGAFCQAFIDYCQSNPCAHGSTCLPKPGGFTCVCTPEYTGPYCQQNA